MAMSSLTSSQKGELMDQVKQQIAVANAQELLTKMTEKCFKKCVGKPGTVLDSSEQVSVHLPDLQGVLYKKALAVQFERLVSIPYCYSAFESLSEMYRNVHGSVYGFLEFSFEDLWAEVAARAFKYVE